MKIRGPAYPADFYKQTILGKTRIVFCVFLLFFSCLNMKILKLISYLNKLVKTNKLKNK